MATYLLAAYLHTVFLLCRDQRELNFCNNYLSLLYFWHCSIYEEKKSIRLNLNIYPLYCTVEKLRGKKYHLRVARAVSKKIPA